MTAAPQLAIEQLGENGRYRVTGGREPHIVTLHANGALCDCRGFEFRRRCRHIAAVEQRPNGEGSGTLVLLGGGPGLERDIPLPGENRAVEPDIARRSEPPVNGGPPLTEDHERYSDTGNARRFVHQHHEDMRYVKTQRRWYAWDGRRWREDATGEAERRAKAVVHGMYKRAADESDETRRKELGKHAVASDNALRIRSMLELASTETEVVLRAEQLDAGPWLLNVQNGTLDLRTAELRSHRRGEYLTKLAPVRWDPDAKAPRWDQFLTEITGGNAELVRFLQRSVGYSLTGDTREQCLFFCHGQGANGKTVFLETVQAMLGADYAQTTPFTSFLAKQSDGPRNDLARLRAVRLVSASEAPGGQPLDEALLKTLVGGDTITARFLHQEFFEFRPAFKLWLRANHKPPVREQTVAFWRRMRLVPFTITIPAERRDRELATKLHAELPGILAWSVRGCLDWQKNKGLGEPKVVTDATAAYRDENDTLGEFIEARCTLDPNAWTATADLYKAFGDWWDETHGKDRPPTRSWFGRALGERSVVVQSPRGRNKTRGWAGIRLTGALPGSTAAEGEARDDLPF